MKKFLCCMAAVLLLLTSFAGCSNSGQGESSSQSYTVISQFFLGAADVVEKWEADLDFHTDVENMKNTTDHFTLKITNYNDNADKTTAVKAVLKGEGVDFTHTYTQEEIAKIGQGVSVEVPLEEGFDVAEMYEAGSLKLELTVTVDGEEKVHNYEWTKDD